MKSTDKKDHARKSRLPIWEELSPLGRSAPPGTRDSAPTDLSIRIDEYVYRANKKSDEGLSRRRR